MTPPTVDKPTIRVTEVGKCRRFTQLDRHIRAPRLPAHFVTARGIIAHLAIESALAGKEPNWEDMASFGLDPAEIPGPMFEAAALDAREGFEKARAWLAGTKLLSGSPVVSEARYTAEYPECFLSGKPDFHNGAVIVDFKTGKKRVFPDHIYQLAGYRDLLSRADGSAPRRAFLVFLGEEKPREVEVTPAQMDEALPRFMADLRVAVSDRRWRIDQPPLPVDVAFHCVFCPQRGNCRGV